MRKFVVLVILIVVPIAGWLTFKHFQQPATPQVFVGESTGLRHTVVVPVLDTKSAAGHNIIWCASFPLAWQQLQSTVFNAPVQLAGKPELSRKLKSSAAVKYYIEDSDYYANAGKIEYGIVSDIQHEMTERFPAADATWLPLPQGSKGIIAYCYLTTHIKFAIPFIQIHEGITFVDSSSLETCVRAFGISGRYEAKLPKLRKQVKVLFYTKKESVKKYITVNALRYDFAVDLSNSSQPYQIVLASVPPKTTLAETIADVKERIAEESMNNPTPVFMSNIDRLYVPEMSWRITHHFPELENAVLLNGGDPIVEAKQIIDFTLNRSGVQLISASNITRQAIPKQLSFTHPFLLYLTRRGTDTPFFAMWVDNAELLNKQRG